MFTIGKLFYMNTLKLLKQHIINKGGTIRNAALEIGVTRTYLSCICSGNRTPGIKVAQKISAYINNKIKWHEIVKDE